METQLRGVAMFHKLSVDALRSGMYIVDTDISWLQHPFLYAKEGLLSPESIADIREQGYLEAFIDLTRCRPGSLPPELSTISITDSAPLPQEYTPSQPRVPLAEEMLAARSIYKSCLGQARELMDNMRKGILDMPSAEPVVDSILESLDRNADALVGLCKLRQTDDYTYTHCVNVSVLSVMFARGLGLSGPSLHAIGMGGLFHDLGKSLIPLRILNAPRKLSDSEFDIMRRHPGLGHEQLEHVGNVPKEVLQVILEHHEKYNGEGYPHGLSGDAISFAGRVASIVDVFDALSSRRVYKEPMPLSKCLSIMYSMRGKEFHPGMVEHFIRLLGVFPVGSVVELEGGTRAVVSGSNPAFPLRPKIIVVCDANSRPLCRKEFDLTENNSPGILRSLTAKDIGVDPAIVLGCLQTA